jgi:serine/threonine-protein kinase
MSDSADKPFAGKWLLERELGGGGMGRVVKARYAASGYPCAIKVLLPEHKHDAELVERFVNEAHLTNRIGHAGVRRVIDVGWTDDKLPYLVMEYLEGSSLEELLQRTGGLLPIGEALRIASRLLEVLVAAHRAGVLHRDIKPDNVYVTHEGAIKILDFGIAKLSGVSLTRAGATFGTVGYMSPESALGTTMSAGYKPDVWSVGVCLFRMLSGQLPVDLSKHVSPLELMRAAATTPARRLSEVLPRCPAALAEVVARMLAFDPEHRYGAAEALTAIERLELPPEVIGQAAPWVWDPRVAARPRSARFTVGGSPNTLRDADLMIELSDDDLEETPEQDDYEELDELYASLRSNPGNVAAMHELARLYARAGELGHAAAIAATLRFLGKADARELELAEQRDASFRLPRGRVSARQWREVLMAAHPSPQLSALLARLWPVLAASRVQAYAEQLAGEPGRRTVEQDGRPTASNLQRIIHHLATVLDLSPPAVVLTDDDVDDFRVLVPGVARAPRPTLLAGRDALAPQPASALVFRCAHALARMHPYLIAGAILPSSTRLRDAIHGASLLTSARVSMSAEHGEKAETWKRLIESLLSAEQLDGLRRSVDRVIRRGGDTKAWLLGCRSTAARAGLLVSGDLDVAAELLRASDADEGAESVIRELVGFSVSRPYLELRRALTRESTGTGPAQ